MRGLAPRAPGDSVRPRRASGASVRPLNFTVSRRAWRRLRNRPGLEQLFAASSFSLLAQSSLLPAPGHWLLWPTPTAGAVFIRGRLHMAPDLSFCCSSVFWASTS